MHHSIVCLLGILSPAASMAQECDNGRYSSDLFIAAPAIFAVPYGSNTSLGGVAQTLYMDVFQPEGDQLAERPVVLVAFGGSFVAGSRSDVAPICQAFARRGFVAIAPDYRIGFFLPNVTTTSQAVLRGAHDLKGCVRFLRKSVAEMENPYRIDTTRIIIGGVSAGAISALHAGLLDLPEEWPAALSTQYDALGGIDGNSGSSGYSSRVKAVFSLSGALGDTLWIDSNSVPICSVHEVGDQVVPYYTQEVAVFSIPTGLVASGSHDIHARADHQGVVNCLLTYPGTGHVGYLNSDPIGSLSFVLDFCAAQVCDQDLSCGNVLASVQEFDPDGTLRLFPNPTSGKITVTPKTRTSISVTDLTGRVIFRRSVVVGSIDLDLSEFAAGTYLIRADDGTAQQCIKIDHR